MNHAQVRYRYRKSGGPWAGSSWSRNVQSRSEQLVMQILRKRHPGCDVDQLDIKWK